MEDLLVSDYYSVLDVPVERIPQMWKMSRISEEVRAYGTEIGVDKKLTLDMV
jgi:hypothetical protein